VQYGIVERLCIIDGETNVSQICSNRYRLGRGAESGGVECGAFVGVALTREGARAEILDDGQVVVCGDADEGVCVHETVAFRAPARGLPDFSIVY
jgi:hypothetical protein